MVETLKSQPLEYQGKTQFKTSQQESNGQRAIPYLPSLELVEAVNLSIYLERPLLLKGEPGCGKTQLAFAVAAELGLPFEPWYIKSTSRARDGLYTYDAVGRLRDAQLVTSGIDEEAAIRAKDADAYVEWGPLGQAFLNEQRTVVLIDEIDKADIDFPNDLLLELDEKRFVVHEVKKDSPIREILAKAAPIVFVTSNDEKDLPDAFLRRCLFHYVEFPGRDRLIQIIHSHFPSASEDLVSQAVTRFVELRDEMQKDKGAIGKKVSTSELIDWFRVLRRYPEDEVLSLLGGKLPFPGVLLKNWEDHIRYLRHSRG